MDPVTQGTVGALFAQTHGPKQALAKAAVLGALAGMAADLDVLIRSTSDPLLAIDFHRQFTHSLFFIPIGGLLCSLLLYPLLGRRWGMSYRHTFIWCLIGYATHALLDGCTTYGTQLLWPFTDQRYSWDIVSVVDPLFTVPLLVLVVLAAIKQSRRYMPLALLWIAVYLSAGYVQHQRAVTMGEELALSRGHTVLRLEAKPSFGNLAVWKVVYETEGRFYIDAVKPGVGGTKIWEGENVAKLNIGRDLPWLDITSQQARDIERFRKSSGGYLAVDPRHPLLVGDIRYSLLPQEVAPLWGIELRPDAASSEHVRFYTRRENAGAALRRILAMIFE